jgi:hypothetical protein
MFILRNSCCSKIFKKSHSNDGISRSSILPNNDFKDSVAFSGVFAMDERPDQQKQF